MIKKEELLVGITYTDISNESRTVIYISTKFVTYVKADGKERTTHLEVMLDVLSLQTTDLKQAA